MTSDSKRPITQEQLRTPKAAAYAGIVFSLLVAASLILVNSSIPPTLSTDSDWLVEHSGRLQTAVTLVPFAAIAFLWFMGVIRDLLGAREDYFFSTIFLGSGLLTIGGLLIWMANINAVLISFEAAPDTWGGSSAYLFGLAKIKVMGLIITLRMSGVFMISSATIWLRTRLMPRWLTILTYVIAIILLIGAPSIWWLLLVFPIWVFVVSIFILRGNRV